MYTQFAFLTLRTDFALNQDGGTTENVNQFYK